MTMPGSVTTAACTPSPTVIARGGISSGSNRTFSFTCAAAKTLPQALDSDGCSARLSTVTPEFVAIGNVNCN